MRLYALLRIAVPLALGASACGEDNQKIVHEVFDTSGGDVNNNVVPEGWQATLESPAEGVVLPEGPVTVKVSLGAEGVSAWVGFKATLTLNGQAVAADTDVEVPTDGVLERTVTGRGGANELVVLVTAPDGSEREITRAFSVNIPPPKPTVVIETADGTRMADTDDELVAIASDVEDVTFGEAGLTKSYRWVRAPGVVLSTAGDRLSPALTERGDTIEVYVKVNDGFTDSEEVKDSIVIGNGAPTCAGVRLTPAAARVDQALTCGCSDFDDPDGDADQSTCTFTDTATGDTLGTPGSCTLPAGSLEPGMSVSCTVTPNDGDSDGEPITNAASANVIVLNSAPSAPVATLSPATGTALTTFTCNLTTAGADPDGDSLTHPVAWTVGGVAHSSTASTATAESLGAGKGEELCCVISADDGQAKTASAPACVTLENAAPPAVSVFIVADGGPPATRRSTLTCNPQGAADPDGDPLTVTYAWYVDGALLSGQTGATLDAGELEIGEVVTCTAKICDDDSACTEALASKNSLGIQNALPTLGGATVVMDGEAANPGETVDCAFSGWDDPDGDPVEVSYEWLYTENGTTTVVAGETSASLEVDAGMEEGATLTCRVTPENGDAKGVAVTSAPVTVGPAIATAPVVAVDAPAGADGPLTCKITTEAQYIPANATWTWRWSLNDVTVTGASAQTLGADQVSHCDLVKCWVEITALDLSLTSNKGTQLMPLGLDCDDGNPCTSAVCLQAGGCNAIPQDGVACDDGDPCSENELCDEGKCVGTIDLCVEDRLSVGTYAGADRVHLTANDEGGYLATFGAPMRLTDADGSRLDEQLDGGAYNGGSVSPSGRVARFRYHSANGTCSVNNNYVCFYWNTRIFDPGLATYTDLPVDVYCGCGTSRPNGGTTLAMSDESFAVLIQYPSYLAAGPTTVQPRIALQLIDPALNKSGGGVLASNVYLGAANQVHGWDAALVPDGSDAFMLTWVDAGRKTIYAQRFSKLGAAEFAAPIEVATTTSTFESAAIAPMSNGRFVVVWQGGGLDAAGQGLVARRFDENGNALGDAFAVNEVATGDQLLGGVAAFSNLRFAVTWRDGSQPTARFMARTFSSTGAGDAQFVVNEATAAGALVPSITNLSNDDFVVGWRDSSNVLWTRRYRYDGVPSKGAAEFRANDEPSNRQESPAAAATLGGNVMVAYQSSVFPGTSFGTEIVTRVFDADGLEVAPEAIVNETTTASQSSPSVAAGADRFVVAWTSEGEDGDGEGIVARVFGEDGQALGAPLAVNVTTTSSQYQPSVAMSSDGVWAAAWTSANGTTLNDVRARVFAANGTPTGEIAVNSTTTGNQERPAVAMVPFTSEALIAWHSQSQTTGRDVFVRKFGFDGTAKSVEIPLNSTTANNQQNASIAVLQSGSFIVCWESVSQVTANKSVVACQRVKTSNMVPQGGEIVPFSWADNQLNPVVRYQADGRIAVAFQSLGIDSDVYAIQLVRINDLGTQVAPRVTANRYWTSDQTRPWLIPMDDRLFLGWQSQGQDGSEGGVFFRILPQAL